MHNKRLNKETVQEITQHEVGHYLIARICGFQTGNISLKFYNNANGHDAGVFMELNQPLKNTNDIIQYLRSRILILFAGVLAENINNGVLNYEDAANSLETTGVDDFSKIKELLNLLRNIQHPETIIEEMQQDELNILNEKLWQETINLVQNELVLIVRIASILSKEIDEHDKKYEFKKSDFENIPQLKERIAKL